MERTQLTHVCQVCGGDGWLPSLPEGQSKCPYCEDGKVAYTPTTELDKAVLAHRNQPTEENRLRVLAAQEAHTARFYGQQARSFVRRTT